MKKLLAAIAMASMAFLNCTAGTHRRNISITNNTDQTVKVSDAVSGHTTSVKPNRSASLDIKVREPHGSFFPSSLKAHVTTITVTDAEGENSIKIDENTKEITVNEGLKLTEGKGCKHTCKNSCKNKAKHKVEKRRHEEKNEVIEQKEQEQSTNEDRRHENKKKEIGHNKHRSNKDEKHKHNKRHHDKNEHRRHEDKDEAIQDTEHRQSVSEDRRHEDKNKEIKRTKHHSHKNEESKHNKNRNKDND